MPVYAVVPCGITVRAGFTFPLASPDYYEGCLLPLHDLVATLVSLLSAPPPTRAGPPQSAGSLSWELQAFRGGWRTGLGLDKALTNFKVGSPALAH